MAESLSSLPPSKRFKLLNQQQQPSPSSSSSDPLPPPCLPAKKRVWAPPPHSPLKPKLNHVTDLVLDLNQPPAETKPRSRKVRFDLGEETRSKSETLEGGSNVEEEKIHQSCKSITETSIKSGIQQKSSDLAEEKDEQQTEHIISETEEVEEDGIICAVCNITDADPANPIVFCDGCDLQVHAFCYGNPLIKSIPTGDWFCEQCLNSTSKQNCCLCFKEGGAVKATVDEKWAHIVCALFVPEVYFKDPEGREMIVCDMVPMEKRRVKCYLCGCKRGCGIRCAEVGCGLEFHASCGVGKGLSLEFMEGRGGGVVAGFCDVHSKIWVKQQHTGKFKIVAGEKI